MFSSNCMKQTKLAWKRGLSLMVCDILFLRCGQCRCVWALLFEPSSFLLLVVRPGTSSSVFAPSSKGLFLVNILISADVSDEKS